MFWFIVVVVVLSCTFVVSLTVQALYFGQLWLELKKTCSYPTFMHCCFICGSITPTQLFSHRSCLAMRSVGMLWVPSANSCDIILTVFAVFFLLSLERKTNEPRACVFSGHLGPLVLL